MSVLTLKLNRQFLSGINFLKDGRNFQIIFLSVFLLVGIRYLKWYDDPFKYPVIMGTAFITQILGDWFLNKKRDLTGLKSAMITSLGLSILFKANFLWVYALCAFIAIASKFIFRVNGKHIFNPANIGIVAAILLTGQAWISPGQWGAAPILLFLVSAAGLMVLFKVGRLDTALGFILTLFILDFCRMIIYQNWEFSVILHKYQNGSLLLFTFFMITDPVTTPNHPLARIIWSCMLGAACFYVSSFMFIHTAPIYLLLAFSVLTPVFDKIFKRERFVWVR
jgi:Na+-transporting NADH:ubiquinone oxidoreductase subunit NqrB